MFLHSRDIATNLCTYANNILNNKRFIYVSCVHVLVPEDPEYPADRVDSNVIFNGALALKLLYNARAGHLPFIFVILLFFLRSLPPNIRSSRTHRSSSETFARLLLALRESKRFIYHIPERRQCSFCAAVKNIEKLKRIVFAMRGGNCVR